MPDWFHAIIGDVNLSLFVLIVYAIDNWLTLLVYQELEIVWLMTERMLTVKQVCLSTVIAVFKCQRITGTLVLFTLVITFVDFILDAE